MIKGGEGVLHYEVRCALQSSKETEKSQVFNHQNEMMTGRKNATAQVKNKCEKKNDIVMDNVTNDNSSLTVQEM